MSLARVVVTAVIVEGRSKTQVAKDYGVARFWVYELLKRFEAEGEAAFETEMASLKMVQKILALIIHKLVAKWSVFIKP